MYGIPYVEEEMVKELEKIAPAVVEYEIENNVNNVDLTFSKSVSNNILTLTLTNNGTKKIDIVYDSFVIFYNEPYDGSPYHTRSVDGGWSNYYYSLSDGPWKSIGMNGRFGGEIMLVPRKPLIIKLKTSNNDLKRDNLWFSLRFWLGDKHDPNNRSQEYIPFIINGGDISTAIKSKLTDGTLRFNIYDKFEAI
jgi:hypothetical protein